MTLIDPILLGSLLALGACTGFLAGLLGIGGGMIIVPFLTAILSTLAVPLDLGVKMAIATSMGTILFTSMSSVRAHQRRGAVRWDLVRAFTPGIVLGALAGSLGLFTFARGTTLAVFFGCFVIFSATQMFLDRTPKPSRTMPGLPGRLGAGAMIGMISGLVGAGGGFISVPFMVWCNISMHAAVATSAALGFPIALANVLGYITGGISIPDLPPGSFGYIWLPGLLAIAIPSVLTAPLGAKTAHMLPVRALKRVFAVILYLLAIYMLWKALH